MRDDALFYLCSLVEYIGRERRLRRGEVAELLGKAALRRIYSHADVLHCEPIAAVAAEFAEAAGLPYGSFDNVADCRYDAPSYWDIGEVFSRLVADAGSGPAPDAAYEVFTSWIADAISDYNSDLYYQPRDYLRECYLAGEVIAA